MQSAETRVSCKATKLTVSVLRAPEEEEEQGFYEEEEGSFAPLHKSMTLRRTILKLSTLLFRLDAGKKGTGKHFTRYPCLRVSGFPCSVCACVCCVVADFLFCTQLSHFAIILRCFQSSV